ncbi:MAG: rhomboid family intramembrane serine protease [Chthoniobacterales bacterium]
MFYCPHCNEKLQRHTLVQGPQWRCASCEGRAVSLAVARRIIDPSAVNHLWQAARGIEKPSATACECPLCRNALREIAVVGEKEHESIRIDVCTSCHSLWFDTHELGQLGKLAPPPAPKKEAAPVLSQKSREIIALAQVEAMRERQNREVLSSNEAPDNYLGVLLTFFGIPVEEDAPLIYRWPFVTWAAGFLMLLCFLFTHGDFFSQMISPTFSEDVFKDWGFLPADALRFGGLTLITSFFLHTGFFHLLGNLSFLLIFGDNVENYLGHLRFFLLLLVASLAGALLHMTFDPRPDTPLVGASGGISGVLVFYALQFPKARLVYLLRFGVFIRWIRFPAFVGFIIWIALQLWGLQSQLDGSGWTSVLGHLGGVCIGILWWISSRRQEGTLEC